MPISIDQQTYENLSSKSCLESVNQFWKVCTEKWFAQQSRMVSLYIQEQQAKEETINRVISQRSNNTTPELLPPPTEKQKQIQKFYLTNWEGTPTTYHFYDSSTGKPTYARWLRKFLDKWDVKLNDPFGDEVVEHRSLNGSIKKGKPKDSLLECYLTNRDDIDKVLTYCMSINDFTVMEATSNIGGSRGPFGEFASAADKALKDKVKKLKTSRNTRPTSEETYDLLVNSSSKFFLTINGLKNAYEAFAAMLKLSATVQNQNYEIDIDLLSPCIVQYCVALKATVKRAIKFRKLLAEYFLSNVKEKEQITILSEQLFTIITSLSLKICDFISAKLAEEAPEGYEPANDTNPSSVTKLELIYTEDEIMKLLRDKFEDSVAAQQNPNFFGSSTATPARNATPRSRMHRSSSRSGVAANNADLPSTPLASSSAPAAAVTPSGSSLSLSRRSSSSRKKKRQPGGDNAPVTPIIKGSSSLQALVSPRGEMSSSAHGERSSSAFASTATGEGVDFTPRRERRSSLRPRNEFFNEQQRSSTGSAGGTPRRQASTPRVDRAASGKNIMEQAAAKTIGQSNS